MAEQNYMSIYRKWLSDPYFDERTKKELRSIADNETEIKDRFYRHLEFGTGGLRGVIGAGTNRMNIYTVRQATQGLANYINKLGLASRGVAISYDSRIMSPEFAEEAALVMNANGIPTRKFPELRPTPELSYAVRYYGCVAGIMITASHNPREYNGYKVYWEDGCQITPPHDQQILAEVRAVTDFADVRTISHAEAASHGLYQLIPDDFEDHYMAELKAQTIHPDVIREMAGDFTIVYTPLNGTGNKPVRRVLRELGFTKVYVVPEQEQPDGNFPTLPFPNPELPQAFDLALKLARKVDADIVLATDPDADRLGVYCKNPATGEYVSFTGNMSGTLLEDYILREHITTDTMPSNPAVVETIVTTDMAKAVAAHYGVHLIEVLTGFKYIGEQIRFFEDGTVKLPDPTTGAPAAPHFVFGLEESYGCLAGTYARDKDACVAVMMLCEAAAYYKKQKKTLWDAMCDLYEEYGYYREGQKSITLKGADGAEKIQQMMSDVRIQSPAKIASWNVLAIRDYLKDERRDLITDSVTKTGLPSSNVLYYELSDNAWCCVRPSGTEPKIKFYFGVKGVSLEDVKKKEKELQAAVMGMFAE